MKTNIYKDFIKWAEKTLNKKIDMKGRPLEIKFFTDGEPYIGTYPSLNYSTYLLSTPSKIDKNK